MPTVLIEFTDPNAGGAQEDEIRVYRDTVDFDAGSLPAPLATLPADSTSFEDTTAGAGSAYFYAVGHVRGSAVALSARAEITTSSGAGAEFSVTVAPGTVSADLTGFPLMIDLSDMPRSFWSNVRADGGNIRAYAADGVTMIPHDVTFIKVGARQGRMFAKTNVASATATTIIVRLLDLSQTRLPAGDVNGQYAVWSGYLVVTVFPDKTNRVDGSTAAVNGVNIDTFDWKETVSRSIGFNQGVAFDGTHYYAVSTNALSKKTTAGATVASNANPVGDMITATGNSVLNHCGAPDIIDGELWVPVQRYPSAVYNNQYIARYSLANLTLVGWFQLTGATRESSGVYFDAALNRLYVTDYDTSGNIPYFSKTTGAYLGQITLTTAINTMQGMTGLDGKYYVNSGTSGGAPGTYELEKSGTVNGRILNTFYSGDDESVFSYGNELIQGKDTGFVRHYAKINRRYDWARIHGTPLGHQVPRTTLWTMAVSWRPTPNIDQQGIFGAYVSSADRHSGMYDFPTTNGIGMWNPTNSWMYPTPRVAPVDYAPIRCAFAQNNAAARKILVNGGSKTEILSSSARPTAGANMFFEIAGGSAGENGFGEYQFGWVRPEYSSDAWLAADAANMNNPAGFYSITAV